MGKRDDQFVIILDIERVFSAEELDVARRTAVQAETVGTDVKLETVAV
jgi:hypothetical protein